MKQLPIELCRRISLVFNYQTKDQEAFICGFLYGLELDLVYRKFLSDNDIQKTHPLYSNNEIRAFHSGYQDSCENDYYRLEHIVSSNEAIKKLEEEQRRGKEIISG